ncbi:MAG: GntR family transcriptional regulator / MocR family aminotransferase [Rhodospirillaceae bacterium]|nr:MAG: GntR family transcriptional regulator / MocR family aminotransferase [Rhodospirillaceae bacterium]
MKPRSTSRTRRVPPLGLAIDPSSPEPLHRQICEQMRRAILEGRLEPGARLPSSRLMAQDLDCARGTVVLAFDQLVAEGYVVSQAGSAMSVAANLPDEMLTVPRTGTPTGGKSVAKPAVARRTRALLAEVAPPTPAGPPLAFPTGQPDREAFPFALWAKLLEREWRRPGSEAASAVHPFGHAGLREAIATYLGVARGFTCAPAEIVVTTGIRHGLSLFAQVVLDEGDMAWIEEPGFVGVREALAGSGVKAVPVAIDEWGFSPEAALALAPDARLAVVAPAHHFPLGTVLSLQRRLELLSWAERARGWIAEDDFDGEYRYSGRPLAPLRTLDRSGRVAYFSSFSKLLFPALRLSFLVLPASLVEATERIMDRVSVRAPLLGQGALARFIAEGHFATHLRRTRQLYAGRRETLLQAAMHRLDGLLTIAPDPGGMHVIARPTPEIARRFDDVAVTAAASAEGLTVQPLSVCYAGRVQRHGLILGYAGTPEAEIDLALVKLRDVVLSSAGARLSPPRRRRGVREVSRGKSSP